MKQFQTVKSPTYPNSHRTPCQLPTHPTVSELPYTDASFTVRWDLRSPFTILPAWQIFRFSTFHMGPSTVTLTTCFPFENPTENYIQCTKWWIFCYYSTVTELHPGGEFDFGWKFWGIFYESDRYIYIYILRITLADVQHGLTHDQLIPEQNKTWTCWYAFVHIDIAALSVSLFLLWWKIFAPWYTVVHIVELTVHLKVLTARPENDANTMETETFLIIGIR